MSDSEIPPQAHATTGGKSLAAAEYPPYKSWRKKYRKMKHKFDGVLEENKTLFKEEQKLEGIARRLRESLDGLLDLLLDLNQSPALPPDLRFNITLPEEHTAVASIPNIVPSDVTPEGANQLLLDYTLAVQRGHIPNLDLHVIREQIDKKLAAQGVSTLEFLESDTPHPRLPEDGTLPDELQGAEPAGYLTAEQEDSYLLRLDARLGDPVSLMKMDEKDKEGEASLHKHWADMTPREVERQIELLNPQSQHNWLARHAKHTGHADIDDNESLASHDIKPTPGRGGGKRNLAKQVGDRAVGRAREGASPSAVSMAEDDDLAFVDDHPQIAGKKRGRADPDGTYRVKGGKGGASAKGKRKRGGDETPTGMGKKAKVDAD
ncbi:uncharacterized protein MYCFIDRAFT_87172 [Pseudocercospora fijiensis CIRAD86]|uniref:IEC3 subunit of the Ino80 complex, chromatin re-modelling-domain-containing protein n=1 Tax=Pseudocercospora fijiensis (strain CIRAD86) TaxID=383855 RepID=M2YXZ5_PSEFD|nr:uncharacterized protein MYCFIDRAFT_87172 [Pseudocercospora fijiensis CIRAD86]EME82550.1 hypothetical protein MYCFIDRAFT_87172 [Pseudocercospora fijiensis CIRAD86]